MNPNPQITPITDDTPVRRRPHRPDPDATPTPAPTPAPGPGRDVTPHPGNPTGGVFGTLIGEQAPPPGRQIPDTGAPDETVSLNDLLLAQLNRPDPMDDWVSDSTRMLRWVQLTINFVATQTGRTRQDVLRDAILGTRPLPAPILDRYYTHLYGQQRPPESGGAD